MTNLGDRTTAAVRAVLGDEVSVGAITQVDHGRGVFSHVMRAELEGSPRVVAVKLLRSDANGGAALTSGAVARELLAYEQLLPETPDVAAPEIFGIAVDEREVPAIVMQDLSSHRHIDQLDGLTDPDLRAIITELIALHRSWSGRPELDTLALRHFTPSHFAADAIDRGAALLDERWSDISSERRATLQRLASIRTTATAAFSHAGEPTLCHGDPRGDNVAFDAADRAVLFDWQQIAVQFGEADLSWLLATSTETEQRRAVEGDIIASYALARQQDAEGTWRRYVTGMVLPGLAVLLLAQRTIDDDRTERFVRTSIERIADAVNDLRVSDAVSS